MKVRYKLGYLLCNSRVQGKIIEFAVRKGLVWEKYLNRPTSLEEESGILKGKLPERVFSIISSFVLFCTKSHLNTRYQIAFPTPCVPILPPRSLSTAILEIWLSLFLLRA